MKTWVVAAAVGVFGIASLRADPDPDALWTGDHHEDQVHSVVFSPSGTALISGSSDRLIRFYRTSDGSVTRTLNSREPMIHERSVEALSISPDNKRLASSSFKAVKLWDLRSGSARVLAGHRDWVLALAFNPKGTVLASGSDDGTVRLWEGHSGRPLGSAAFPGQVLAVAWSPDGRYLAAAGGNGLIRIFLSASLLRVREIDAHTSDVTCLAFAPDGTVLASGSMDGLVHLWTVPTWRRRATIEGSGAQILSVAFSPDGREVVSCDGEGGLVQIASASDGARLRTVQGVSATAVRVAANGLLAYGHRDGSVTVSKALRPSGFHPPTPKPQPKPTPPPSKPKPVPLPKPVPKPNPPIPSPPEDSGGKIPPPNYSRQPPKPAKPPTGNDSGNGVRLKSARESKGEEGSKR